MSEQDPIGTALAWLIILIAVVGTLIVALLFWAAAV
jgi:hypothetical protein